MLSIQEHRAERFQIILTSMKRKKLTKAEWLTRIPAVVSLVAAAASVSSAVIQYHNRQDTQAQSNQVTLNEQMDGRIDKKLGPLQSDLTHRATDESLKQSARDIMKELKDGLDGIRAEITKTNELAEQTHADLSKLTGRVDGIDKDLNLLLQRQLKAAADFPPQVLAGQIPNVYFLYQLALQRNASIPDDTTNVLRVKLAGVNSNDSEYWKLASMVLSRASRSLVGELNTKGRIRGTVTGNTFSNQYVVLDGSHFSYNIFRNCLIEYRGGDAAVEHNLFIDCLFVVALTSEPPPGGQKVLRTLLASNLRSVQQN